MWKLFCYPIFQLLCLFPFYERVFTDRSTSDVIWESEREAVSSPLTTLISITSHCKSMVHIASDVSIKNSLGNKAPFNKIGLATEMIQKVPFSPMQENSQGSCFVCWSHIDLLALEYSLRRAGPPRTVQTSPIQVWEALLRVRPHRASLCPCSGPFSKGRSQVPLLAQKGQGRHVLGREATS